MKRTESELETIADQWILSDNLQSKEIVSKGFKGGFVFSYTLGYKECQDDLQVKWQNTEDGLPIDNDDYWSENDNGEVKMMRGFLITQDNTSYFTRVTRPTRD